MKHITLLVIDPQNDFCDLPNAYRPQDPVTGNPLAPALPVTGAHEDMLRLARLIDRFGPQLSEIVVTLDSHHRLDIAHPPFWMRSDGSAVSPFTQITAADVRAGVYKTRDPDAQTRALAYLDELEARGRYTLMVWPIHCEIGSWGHNVHADVRAAYSRWEELQMRSVTKVIKGMNPWTEHYSAVLAEVPDANDPDTQLNQKLIDRLDRSDMILIAGEASSHCVKATTEHIVAALGSGKLQKMVLITDCMSPVGGFEGQHVSFLAEMESKGVKNMKSDQIGSVI